MKRLLTILMALAVTLTALAADPVRVRVLSIGNSFSRDAFSYVPFLMEEMVPAAEVEFGILYIGGCSLERHRRNLESGEPAYEFDFYRTGQQHWTLERQVSLQQGVERLPWDIIILQQQSAASRYYETYQPHLDILLDYLRRARPQATFAWLMTQAYGTGYKPLGNMSMDEMWARVNAASQRALDETAIQLMIPAGTGIQNARYTPLDRLGAAGHLVNDGFHLQEGIPPLIEGLTATAVLMRHYGVEVDVEKSRLQITPQWRRERQIPQPNGEPEQASDEDYRLARQCARWALESPWQLTVVEEGGDN